MSNSSIDSPLDKHDPYAALRQPAFVIYAVASLFSGTGQMLLSAVMAWQVYEISDSELDLGLLGLIRFVPALGLSLVGGAFADAYNRRNVVLAAQCIPLSCSIILAVATFGGWIGTELIFGLVLVIGLASAFEGPARAALLPSIVRGETFTNAVTVSSTLRTVSMVSGPTLAGFIIAAAGVGAAYGSHAAVYAASILLLMLLRYDPKTAGRRSLNVEAIKEGVRFVRSRQVLIGIMALDMFAVIFGGATALMPVYATDILHVGATGFGLLAASMNIGAMAMAAFLIFRPPIQATGKALVFCVILYGLGTIAFGFSRIFVLSLVLYMFIGAADQISVVIRDATIQIVTPSEMRGRVSAIYLVFIGASNQLGTFESGLVAALTSATFAVVSGGVGALVTTAVIAWRLPDLFHYRVEPHVVGESEGPRPRSEVREQAAEAPATPAGGP